MTLATAAMGMMMGQQCRKQTMLESNEITGFVASCVNIGFLERLQEVVTERLEALRRGNAASADATQERRAVYVSK